MPSFLQAPAQFAPRASATPVVCCNFWSAFVHASKIAGQTEAAVVLPPLAPDGGNCVSPILAVICSGFRPKTSAATTATERARARSEILRAAPDLDAAIGIDLRIRLRPAAAAAPCRARAPDAHLDRARAKNPVACISASNRTAPRRSDIRAGGLARVVLEPKFQRIHFQFHRQIVHDPFHAERGDRMTRRAERARLTRIDGHRGLFHASIGNRIDIRRGKTGPAATAGRMPYRRRCPRCQRHPCRTRRAFRPRPPPDRYALE